MDLKGLLQVFQKIFLKNQPFFQKFFFLNNHEFEKISFKKSMAKLCLTFKNLKKNPHFIKFFFLKYTAKDI